MKLVKKVLMVGVSGGVVAVAGSAVAGAHDGHACDGWQSGGFSCSVYRDPVTGAQVIATHYDGSRRGEVSAPAGGRGTFFACDLRSSDTIRSSLILDVSGADDIELRSPGDGCAGMTPDREITAMRLLNRNDTGGFSHGTRWYPVPSSPVGPLPPADRDGDSVLPPLDCDEGDPRRHAGAPDVPGNGLDEDCDGVDAQPPPEAPPARITAGVAHEWTVDGRVTRLRFLGVRDAPPGATATVSCQVRRCVLRKRRTVTVGRGGRATLTRLFRSRRLRAGTVVEVRITAANMVGKVVRYRTRAGVLPRHRVLCLPPAARRPARCG